MNTVYVVQHSYELRDRDEVKFIGVYGSESDAEAAIGRLRDQPGFRNHADGFHIDRYKVGEDHWREGFASLVTIMVPLVGAGREALRPVHAAMLPLDRYEIVTPNDGDERWAFSTGQVVVCEERPVDGGVLLVATSLAGETLPNQPLQPTSGGTIEVE